MLRLIAEKSNSAPERGSLVSENTRNNKPVNHPGIHQKVISPQSISVFDDGDGPNRSVFEDQLKSNEVTGSERLTVSDSLRVMGSSTGEQQLNFQSSKSETHTDELIVPDTSHERRSRRYKKIDAPPEVLKNYHESSLYGHVPSTLKLQKMLRGGAVGYTIYICEFMGAFLSGLFYIWATYSYSTPHWVITGQNVISVAFTFDYALRVYSEPARLYYLTSAGGIIDALAVIPIVTLFIGNKPGGWTDVLHLLQFLRILRIYPLLHKIGIRGTNVQQQLFLLLISIIGILLVDAGFVHYVEYQYLQTHPELGCDSRGCITFFQAVYFVWVTVSTVGYGDITPKSDYGRLVAMLTILMALVILPLQITRLTTLADRRPYGGTFPVSKVTGSRYVVVSGSISYATIETFLAEFYQSTHDKDLLAYLDTTYALRTIIMAPFRPSHRLTTLIAKYNGVVEFIEGSPLKEEDLNRVQARAASAFFILSDASSENPVSEDNTQIVRALSVHRYCGKDTRIIVDVHRPETESSEVWKSLERAPRSLQVICVDKIRYKLLARSCFVRGLHTFISNLFMPEVELRGFPEDSYVSEYQDGFSNEVYPLIFPSVFVGHKFEQVAEFLYSEQRVLLFAVDAEGSGAILLNPTGRVMGPLDLGLVMAGGVEDAFRISEIGGTAAGEQQRCVCAFGWKCGCKGREGTLLNPVKGLALSNSESSLEEKWEAFLSHRVQGLKDQAAPQFELHFSSGSTMINDWLAQKEGSSLQLGPEHSRDMESLLSVMAEGAGLEAEEGQEVEKEGVQEVGNRVQEEEVVDRFPKTYSVRSAVSRLLKWPPEEGTGRPYPAVLARQAQAISDDLKKKTKDIVMFREKHLLICAEDELSPNLFYFLETLRRPGLPAVPVVVLHPADLTVEQWGNIGLFPEVYFVRGSPLFDVDLLRAGVLHAERVVVLCKSGKPEDPSDEVQETLPRGRLGSTTAYDSDIHNIIIASNLERLFSQKEESLLIVEFQHPTNIQHLKPHLILGRRNVGGSDWNRHRETILNFCPAYMEGKASSPSHLGFVQRALYNNSNALKIVKLLMEGQRETPAEEKAGGGQRGVEQIEVPAQFVGRPFLELFRKLLEAHGVLAIGLYRAPGSLGSPMAYVYTNPRQDSLVGSGDRVFVLL